MLKLIFIFLKIFLIEIKGSAQPINLKLFGKFSNLLNPTMPQPIKPILKIFYFSLYSSN